MHSAAVFGKYMRKTSCILRFPVFAMYFCSPLEVDDSFFPDKKSKPFAHNLLSFTFTFSIQCYEKCWEFPLAVKYKSFMVSLKKITDELSLAHLIAVYYYRSQYNASNTHTRKLLKDEVHCVIDGNSASSN